MADIFVSYRRDDSQWSAGRINDRLAVEFGAERLFFDTITIEPGDDFVDVIGAKVGGCRVMLVVIGPKWLELLESRIAETNDFVRIEIAEAIRRGIRLVPVLIDGATPPPEARLPDDIKPLARRQAIWVRANTFQGDLTTLTAFLRRQLDPVPVTQPRPVTAAPAAPDHAVEGRIKIDARRVEGPSEAARAGWLKPGAGKTEWFQDHPLAPEMVVVPPGEFLMGSPPDEEGRWDDGREGPQHLVTIAAPFAMGRCAVTVGEFTAFVEATGHTVPDKMHTYKGGEWKQRDGHSFRNPGFAQSARNPVVGVSSEDAVAYCKWLSGTTGQVYRLPSEAEWEYVCRAGTDTPFWWGSSISTERANYDGNGTYAGGAKGEYRQRTMPVDSFEPNPWGLYQVHGNVWEWCADHWHGTYRGAPEDGSPWLGGDKSLFVVRGGSWSNYPWILRSANRLGLHPVIRGNLLGFRVARTLTP